MFDLEQSLAEWRRQMLAAGIQTPVPLEELEAHLREEIERLVKSGLGERSAFISAVQEIGPIHALRSEFEKVEQTKKSHRWKLFEIFFLVNTLLIPLAAASQAFVFKDGGFSEMTTGQQIAILSGAVAFSAFAWAMRLCHGRFPVLRSNRIRDAIFVPVLFLVIAGILILPHCDFTDGTRAVVSLWVFTPFGILIGWAWGFATAERTKAVRAGS
jgi:hypothetical protein